MYIWRLVWNCSRKYWEMHEFAVIKFANCKGWYVRSRKIIFVNHLVFEILKFPLIWERISIIVIRMRVVVCVYSVHKIVCPFVNFVKFSPSLTWYLAKNKFRTWVCVVHISLVSYMIMSINVNSVMSNVKHPRPVDSSAQMNIDCRYR